MRPNKIVLRSPELTLKGRNRGLFEEALVRNVAHRLRGLGRRWRVRGAHGRVYVDLGADAPADLDEILQALTEVAGVESVAATYWLAAEITRQDSGELDRQVIEATLVELAEESFRDGSSFAVRVNRVDKRLAMSSIDMERWLGQVIRDQTAWDRVDLTQPERIFAIDVYPDGIYLRVGKVPAIGGLPVGTGGRVLALLSGGIDSPVAAFELTKRGCQVDFFHLSASHAQQRDDAAPVARLAKSLSRFTLRSRLFTAPATHLDLALTGPPSGFEALVFRRFLMRTGAMLARRLGARALITGDSLGQVASQTLENLSTVYQATAMPILSPLIGANKQRTIDTARQIGTYEISIEPYKDCCALLALSPKTRSEPHELEALENERLPDYDGLVTQTMSDLVWRAFDCGRAVGAWQTSDDYRVPAAAARDTAAARDSRAADAAGDDGEASTAR